MVSVTSTFEWSVGLGAWLSLVVLTLPHNLSGYKKTAVYVAAPLLSVGLVYTTASFFLMLLRCFLFVVFAMLRAEVLLGVALCAVATVAVRGFLGLRASVLADPSSVSPTVLATILRFEILAIRVESLFARGVVIAQAFLARTFPTGSATVSATAATAAPVETAATAAPVETAATAAPVETAEPEAAAPEAAAPVETAAPETIESLAPAPPLEPLTPLLPLEPPRRQLETE
jgi:hypothetical protein